MLQLTAKKHDGYAELTLLLDGYCSNNSNLIYEDSAINEKAVREVFHTYTYDMDMEHV